MGSFFGECDEEGSTATERRGYNFDRQNDGNRAGCPTIRRQSTPTERRGYNGETSSNCGVLLGWGGPILDGYVI